MYKSDNSYIIGTIHILHILLSDITSYIRTYGVQNTNTKTKTLELEISDFSVDPPCTATQNRDGVKVAPMRMEVIGDSVGIGGQSGCFGMLFIGSWLYRVLGVFWGILVFRHSSNLESCAFIRLELRVNGGDRSWDRYLRNIREMYNIYKGEYAQGVSHALAYT